MDPRVKKAISYLSEHLDQPVGLKEMAAIAFTSPTYFHVLFRKEFGLPLRQFIEKYKIEKALKLITDTNSTVMEISQQLGYKNYETFTRAFKRQFKIAPDDLKAVIAAAINNLGEPDAEQKKLIVVRSKEEAESASAISDVVKTMMGKELSNEELKHSIVLSIENPSNTKPAVRSVQNKFMIKDRSSEWQAAMNTLISEGLL
jgi:AraC-like DNA-binding protein